MSTVTVTIITAALLLVRALGLRLIRFDGRSQPAPPQTEGFRFSIRGLMVLTAAVALLIAGVRALQDSPPRFVLLMVIWAICFVVVGLVAVWAVLAVGHPLRRVPVVFVVSPVLGMVFAFAAGADLDGLIYIILIMLLYPTLLVGSLLVVRSCGYRFVRRVASSSRPTDAPSGLMPFEIPANGVRAPK